VPEMGILAVDDTDLIRSVPPRLSLGNSGGCAGNFNAAVLAC
jgi:hypothetical protein